MRRRFKETQLVAKHGESLRLGSCIRARPQAQKDLAVKGRGFAFLKHTIPASLSHSGGFPLLQGYYFLRDAQGTVLSVYDDNGTPLRQKEVYLYGSSRLGIFRPNGSRSMAANGTYSRVLQRKEYELTDHLGNVRAVIGDNREQEIDPQGNVRLRAALRSYFNHYAFGLEMPGMVWKGGGYRYGYNGKEIDKDFANNYDYGFRIYNPGIAKFLSVDPLAASYPFYTPYQFAGNTPISAIDLDGLEPLVASKYKTLEELGKKIEFEYTSTEINGKCIDQVRLVHRFKDVVLVTTLTEGTSQENLKGFWGKVGFVASSDPYLSLSLNKIDNMSYRNKNDSKLAFVDMGKEMIKNVKDNLRDEKGLENTMLHVNGQALITALFGVGVANEAGLMHERGQATLRNGAFRTEEATKAAIDNYSDLINNEWGQRWGEQLMTELGINAGTSWTNNTTARFLNGLQQRYSRTLNVEFKKEFTEDDKFVKSYTEFINDGK